MPPVLSPSDPWRQIDLACYLAELAGDDPDRPSLRKAGDYKHCAVPNWQKHWTLAGAVLEVLDGPDRRNRAAD